MEQKGRVARLIAFAVLLAVAPGPAASVLFGQEPGFRVMVTEKGLDYVGEISGPILKEQLSQLSFSEIHDESRVAVVGKVKYSLTQISMKEVHIARTALESGEKGLTVHISGMTLAMNARWKYKQKSWPKISDDGKVDIAAKDLSLSHTVSVRNDGSGKIVISSESCSFDVRKISVKFHGGASWLYNLFTSFIESNIKNQLKSQVCKKITEVVDDIGNKITSSLPMNVYVNDDVGVSCALIGDPAFTTSYLLTHHNGEFISKQHSQEAPLSPLPLPPPSSVDTGSKMAYIWLTSFPLDTASHLYWEAGHMRYDVSHDEVPHFLLRTTTDFKTIVPQLYEQFPDVAVMYGVKTALAPSLLLSTGQASLVAETELGLYVSESGQPSLAFSLTVSVQCDVKAMLQSRPSGQFITGEVTSFTTKIVSVNSNIGELTSSSFQDLLDVAIKFLAIPNINRVLREGPAIPTRDGVTATNTVISIGEGHILVGTDLSYVPQ